jgi:hypothetical protein
MGRNPANATDAEQLAAQDAEAFALVYDRHAKQCSGGHGRGSASTPPI